MAVKYPGIQDHVRAAFKAKKTVENSEIYQFVADKLGVNHTDPDFRHSVRATIEVLNKNGEIRNVGRGVWQIV